MSEQPNWQRDEMQQVGADYADPAEVAAYEAKHRSFRNIEEENERVVRALGLGARSTVIDMGAGIGFFALEAARRCAEVYAVDVSPAMLAYARGKAEAEGLTNIRFHHAGFLTYAHEGDPVDAIVSTAVLHHLPDFWKFVGLARLRTVLKENGRLLLRDLVFPSDVDDPTGVLDEAVRQAADHVGEHMAAEFATHFREEFSTFDWIMDGLLVRAGFVVEEIEHGQKGRGLTTYLCRADAQ